MSGTLELTVAFCDDDPVFRGLMAETVLASLARRGAAAGSAEASCARELEALLESRRFDLLFLDIDMPDLDGIRLGERLRGRGFTGDIIYVSQMEDKVYEIFGVHPWSFLRKSRFSEEADGVVGEYVRHLQERRPALVVTDAEGRTLSLAPEELVYVEAAGKLQKLFLAGRPEPLRVRSSLQALDGELQALGFIRIHKGFSVNYRFVRRITSRGVQLDTGRELPVGRDRLATARERYLDLMKWKGLSRPAPAD